MRNLQIAAIFAVVAIATLSVFPPLAIVPGLISLFYLAIALKQMVDYANAERQEAEASNAQLATELSAVYALFTQKLVGAPVRLHREVSQLLFEGAKHLGNPPLRGRPTPTARECVGWNRRGLELVAEAKALITAHETSMAI